MVADREPTPEETYERQLDRLSVLENEENIEDLEELIFEDVHAVKSGTIETRVTALLILGKHLGKRPWLDANRRDIITAITKHRTNRGKHLCKEGNKPKNAGRPLDRATRYQVMMHQRLYYKRWLNTEDTPPMFRNLPFKKSEDLRKSAREKVISPDGLRRMFAAAGDNLRDQTIVLVGAEGGFRAAEMAALQLDGVEEEDYGYYLFLPEDAPKLKTGPREIGVPIIAARDYLERYIAQHPRRHEEGARLFLTQSNRTRDQPMSGRSIGDVIIRLAERAGLPHITAHWLRHGSASLKIEMGHPVELVRLIHGWSSLSMVEHYTHVSTKYKAMVRKAYGIEAEPDDILDVLGSKKCMLCGQPVKISDDECTGCGSIASGAIERAEERRRQRAAVMLAAVPVATSLGWTSNDEDVAHEMEQAIEFLEAYYERTANQPSGTRAWVKWCMVQWGSLKGD